MKKNPKSVLVFSIISAVLALIAIIFSILFMLAIKYDSGTSGDFITDEVKVFLFEFVFYLVVSVSAALDGIATGIIGMILAVKKKCIQLIWLPILGLLGSLSSFAILVFSFVLLKEFY